MLLLCHQETDTEAANLHVTKVNCTPVCRHLVPTVYAFLHMLWPHRISEFNYVNRSVKLNFGIFVCISFYGIDL